MNTKEAFLNLLGDVEYLKTQPLNERNKISSYKSLYASGKLKLKGIQDFLTKHGYTIKRDVEWEKVIKINIL